MPSLVVRCVAVCWSWWNARNKFREEARKINIDSLVWQILSTEREFLQYFGSKKQPKQNTEIWGKPPQDYLKINTDGSYNSGNGLGAWGFVIRDLDGEVVVAGAGGMCRSACSSQCNQKTNLMEETRQHVIRQHSPSCVAPSGLNVYGKWAAI